MLQLPKTLIFLSNGERAVMGVLPLFLLANYYKKGTKAGQKLNEQAETSS